jgi:hypothetical protein
VWITLAEDPGASQNTTVSQFRFRQNCWLAEVSKADCAVLIALRNPLPALTPSPIQYRQVWAAKMIAPNLPDLQDSMCMIPKHASTIPC